MSNYQQFKSFLNNLAQQYGKNIETNLHEASFDNSRKPVVYVYEKDRVSLNVINMDLFSQQVFTKTKYTQTELSGRKDINDLAIATVDGLIIDKNNEWYFIEFKNQQISKAKESVVKKAYQNYYLLLSLFCDYSNKYKNTDFNTEEPLQFAKKNITYILVVSENENLVDVTRMHNMSLAGEYVRPEYMDKLRHYLFKDAYVYLPSDFEREFVSKFVY